MLTGATRQEVEDIVEQRARPLDNAQSYLRTNFFSLKRDLADLHGGVGAFHNDQTAWNARLIDSVADVRSQVRNLGIELTTFRAEADLRFTSLETHARAVDGRLDGIDGRLDGIDGRLDGVNGRLDGIERTLLEVRDLVGGPAPPDG